MPNGNGTGGPLITQDQVMAITRQLVPLVAGIAIGKGWLTVDQAANFTQLMYEVAGPVAAIGGAVMAYYANSKHSILTSVANMPEVKKVVVSDPDMAKSVTSEKVDTK